MWARVKNANMEILKIENLKQGKFWLAYISYASSQISSYIWSMEANYINTHW